MRPACVWSGIFSLKQTKDGRRRFLNLSRSWAQPCSLLRGQSGFKHLVGSYVPTTQHLWLLARSVVRTTKILILPFSFRKDEENHVAMLVARSPRWRGCRQSTELPCCRRVVSVSVLSALAKKYKFEEQTGRWKTVIGASCPPAPQIYMCHVIFDRATG